MYTSPFDSCLTLEDFMMVLTNLFFAPWCLYTASREELVGEYIQAFQTMRSMNGDPLMPCPEEYVEQVIHRLEHPSDPFRGLRDVHDLLFPTGASRDYVYDPKQTITLSSVVTRCMRMIVGVVSDRPSVSPASVVRVEPPAVAMSPGELADLLSTLDEDQELQKAFMNSEQQRVLNDSGDRLPQAITSHIDAILDMEHGLNSRPTAPVITGLPSLAVTSFVRAGGETYGGFGDLPTRVEAANLARALSLSTLSTTSNDPGDYAMTQAEEDSQIQAALEASMMMDMS
jgi:hypothetical protein